MSSSSSAGYRSTYLLPHELQHCRRPLPMPRRQDFFVQLLNKNSNRGNSSATAGSCEAEREPQLWEEVHITGSRTATGDGARNATPHRYAESRRPSENRLAGSRQASERPWSPARAAADDEASGAWAGHGSAIVETHEAEWRRHPVSRSSVSSARTAFVSPERYRTVDGVNFVQPRPLTDATRSGEPSARGASRVEDAVRESIQTRQPSARPAMPTTSLNGGVVTAIASPNERRRNLKTWAC